MDLYTLNNNFLPTDNVDEFVSAIWTERYSKAGDVQLVVPATKANIEQLADGTYLGLRGSKEVMILETQSIENQLMTVVGSDLLTFLNQRYVWYMNTSIDASNPDTWISDYVVSSGLPGQVIADVVKQTVIARVAFNRQYGDNLELNGDADKIPGLSLGAVDTTGPPKPITVPIGPLYDGIAKVADDEGVGISLYLASTDRIFGYTLKFTTYRGQDHTTGGSGALVRLTPDFDSIQDLKEVRSIQQFKNVVYILKDGILSKHVLDPTQPEPEGFNRRFLIQDVDQEGKAHPGYAADYRAQVAKDIFANHNYIQTIDGQSSPISEYQYGVHYGLGDLIELESFTGAIAKARVTEYIRSEDKSGEKGYPTITVA